MSSQGQGKVLDLNLQSEIALVQLLESKAEVEFPAAELRIEKTTKCTDCRGCSVSKLQDDEEEAVRVDDDQRRSASLIAKDRAGAMTDAIEEAEDADL